MNVKYELETVFLLLQYMYCCTANERLSAIIRHSDVTRIKYTVYDGTIARRLRLLCFAFGRYLLRRQIDRWKNIFCRAKVLLLPGDLEATRYHDLN